MLCSVPGGLLRNRLQLGNIALLGNGCKFSSHISPNEKLDTELLKRICLRLDKQLSLDNIDWASNSSKKAATL